MLEDVKNILNAKNIEDVRAWCNERRVEIMDEGFGEFVYDYMFEFACDATYIGKLLLNYEEEWLEIYDETREHKNIRITDDEKKAIENTYPYIATKNIKKTTVESNILKGNQVPVYTIKEAANAISCSDKHIRNLIKRGDLKAEVINAGKKKNHYRISAVDLDAFLGSKN